MSGRVAALVGVFVAVVVVGVGLVTLGGVEGYVKPIAPTSSASAAPSRVPEPHPDWQPTTAAPTDPAAPTTGAPEEPPATVTAGAYCDTVGARGVTKKGTPMRCTRKAGEDRPRWRSGG